MVFKHTKLQLRFKGPSWSIHVLQNSVSQVATSPEPDAIVQNPILPQSDLCLLQLQGLSSTY